MGKRKAQRLHRVQNPVQQLSTCTNLGTSYGLDCPPHTFYLRILVQGEGLTGDDDSFSKIMAARGEVGPDLGGRGWTSCGHPGPFPTMGVQSLECNTGSFSEHQNPRKQLSSFLAMILSHVTTGLAMKVASGLHKQKANLCYV